MTTLKTTVAGIEIEASDAMELARQVKDIQEMVAQGILNPPAQAQKNGPAWYEEAWNWTCETADQVYNTSTKDVVDTVCSATTNAWNGICDAITGTPNDN